MRGGITGIPMDEDLERLKGSIGEVRRTGSRDCKERLTGEDLIVCQFSGNFGGQFCQTE